MLISTAYAQAAGAAPAAPSPLLQLAPLVFIFVVFYFLLIRPQAQARKKHQEMISAAKKGDEVITAGGVHGKITKVMDSDVMVEIASGVSIKVVKSTLSAIGTKSAPAANDG
ncbi:MAG: preprotein translocase subunit YajC [Alphaproteobacteria bacterium]|nr:preprotein translocase subunit YajC [Alphaproteobacteria bacterium]